MSFIRHSSSMFRERITATTRRHMSVYGYGAQWTGALSRGRDNLITDEAPELSPEEIQQLGESQNMVKLKGLDDDMKCVTASAGWGHTAMIAQDSNNERKLMVCGRPHDFQTLMRLRRLPPFLRDFCVQYSLPLEGDDINGTTTSTEPSMLQKIASFLAGENEVTFHEHEYRRYSNIPEMLEIKIPSGSAIEGDRIGNEVFDLHGTKNTANSSKQQPLHTHYQNTLATSAGTTAVISKTGTLYMFGLNQRGQCGSGTFTPNVWNPSPVHGLAFKRYILDHGTGIGENLFKEFNEQENPIVSVALGLQHGIALDSEGQVFCWGKGERGQLGQGRRLADDDDAQGQDDEPNENRTFEHALHVENFYDPSATKSAKEDIYAPLLSQSDSKIGLISAGMNFSLAVTSSNLPYIWGKNCVPNQSYSASDFNIRAKPVEDSTYPRYIPGLPNNLQIIKVACGTHHAAMLLEDGSIWAVGVATDSPVPMWDEAVEILSPGIVDTSEIISFQAGFDRTVIVYGLESGKRQVIEIQLWSSEELRQFGAVRPPYLDWLLQEEGSQKVLSVHRGWMHTVVVTE